MGVRHSYRPLRSRFAKIIGSRTRKEATRSCSGGATAVIRKLVRTLARWVAIMGTLALGVAGCGKAMQIPPQATYTEIQASGAAAKPPNCDIKVLRHEPLTEYRKVGIIEGTGSVYASEEDVLPAVKRKAVRRAPTRSSFWPASRRPRRTWSAITSTRSRLYTAKIPTFRSAPTSRTRFVN